MLLFVVLINDPSFLLSSRQKQFSSLRWSQTSNCFSLVAEFHLKFWDVCHKPTTNLCFSLLTLQQLRSILLCKDAFQTHLWQKLAFSSPFCYSNDLSSILSSGGIAMLLFSLIISNWEDHVLFVLIHLTRVLCHLFKFFSSYQVLHLFSTGVLSKFVLPCSLFISFQPEWFQFLLVHCTRHS